VLFTFVLEIIKSVHNKVFTMKNKKNSLPVEQAADHGIKQVVRYLLNKEAAIEQKPITVSLPEDQCNFINRHFGRGEKGDFVARAIAYYLKKSGVEIDVDGRIVNQADLFTQNVPESGAEI